MRRPTLVRSALCLTALLLFLGCGSAADETSPAAAFMYMQLALEEMRAGTP